MSDEEFFARWSRRKRQAKGGGDVPAPVQPADTQEPAPSRGIEGAPETEPDLANLPAIDSITAATDVTAFLRKGIPSELSRAALRRAWASDPAIRDFVGLAENAWDFNDPQAMPGFGPLDCSEAQLGALVDRIVGGVRSAAVAAAEQGEQQKEEQSEMSGSVTSQHESRSGSNVPETNLGCAPAAAGSTDPSPVSFAVVQREPSPGEDENDLTSPRGRMHGGALPR